jgi:RND family efflux transporter MFP subunit
MIRKYILPFAAMLGLIIAVGAIVMGNRPAVPSSSAVPAAQAPYESYIAGAGLVESSTENIAIGTPVSGIVTEINVKIGDHVETGDPLFKIDDHTLQAELLPAMAKIAEAQANLDKATADLRIAERIRNPGSIGAEDMAERRADVAIGEAVVDTAEAQVKQIKMEIERHTIRSPLAGNILQIKIHPGEFAEAGVFAVPLMLMGGNSHMNVRVDIDEYDAWRFKPDEPATASGRGNPSLTIPLTYVRTEPYVIPKTSLTGNSTERTDTRVLQVIYRLDPAAALLYIGQQVDVYIKAAPAGKQ